MRLVALSTALLTLGGCSMVRGVAGTGASPSIPGKGAQAEEPAHDAPAEKVVPRAEHKTPYGNPRSYEHDGRTYRVMRTSRGYVQEGWASWYGPDFHGKRTSSGERYDMYALTAAHRTLPLPTYVRVTNLENGKSVVVRVNDRGPFHDPERRIIDLSFAAARALDMVGAGTIRVRVRALDPPAKDPPGG